MVIALTQRYESVLTAANAPRCKVPLVTETETQH